MTSGPVAPVSRLDMASRPDATARPARLRGLAATGLLAAVTVAWAALPVAGADPGTRLAVIVAVVCAIAGLARLAIGDLEIGGNAFDPPLVRLGAYVAHLLRSVPWPEGMIIAVLVLEALHHDGAWHTGVLAVALLAWLFAAHLAESGSALRILAPQLRVIAAGLGLLVLAIGAAALPAAHPGPATELLRALAVLAAVIAAGLALPMSRTTDRLLRRAPRPGSDR
jgi:hypothetical protein